MAKKGKNILTRKQVNKIGLNKVSVITADMLEGYTIIGEGAFYECISLTSIEIPNSVTSIGWYAFYGCTGLTSVTIGNSITSIGDRAFYGCTSLTSPVYNARVFAFMPTSYSGAYTIPDGIESIAGGAFWGCSGLTSVTIPNSVTSIEEAAFYRCSGLTKVNITDIATWCNIAFISIDSNPLYYAKHLFVNDVEVTNLVIPNSVTSIGHDAFAGCSGLTSVTIGNSVTEIGHGAFSGCSGLTSVEIPNIVTIIGWRAFYGCHRLASVTIGEIIYKKQTITNGKCKAYKGFNSNMTCRNFQYKEGKSYEIEGRPKLCVQGFHACLSLSDVFNYYSGEMGKGMIVYVVELMGISSERKLDSKVVAKKITIGRRIL